MSRRMSGSGGEGSVGKKKVAVVGSGRGPGRKSWEGEEKSAVKVKALDHRAILRTQVVISQRLSDASSKEQPNIEEGSPKIEKKMVKTMESSPKEKENHIGPKITIHDRKWTDGSIPLDTVSDSLARLGKEALQRRNIASAAAAEALEEAMATESIIRCLSMFSDICSFSKAENPLPIIDKFLTIYNDTTKWISSISEPLLSSRNTNAYSNENIQLDKSKPVSLWVDAALCTNLEVITLLTNLDITSNHKTSTKPLTTSAAKKNTVSTRGTQSVSENVSLAKALRREMQSWFMKFVENVLDVGFGLFGEGEGLGRDNGRVAAVLSHLKRVNEWLDEVGKKKDDELVEKISPILHEQVVISKSFPSPSDS